MDFIPIYIPTVAKNQKKYVNECLDTNWISSRGKYVTLFEEQLKDYLQVKNVITCCNGSVSLMLILKGLGISPRDEVITQSLTYVATVSSILNIGATPVLVDSDRTYQMDVTRVKKAITSKTKAIIVAQLYGDSCLLFPLLKLCKEEGIMLIEDSAECFGCNHDATYHFESDAYKSLAQTPKQRLGTFGDASSFSFFGNKVITTGEGGCVCTDNNELADKIRLLKTQSHIGGFKHIGPGYNFRMTNIQAAIGVAQLEDLEYILERKKFIAEYYRSNLSDVMGKIIPNSFIESSEWMPFFKLPKTITYSKFHDELIKEYGIDTRPCFTPIHLMEGFDKCKVKEVNYCEKIYQSGFNLPSYPDLTDKQLKYIVDSVNKVATSIG